MYELIKMNNIYYVLTNKYFLKKFSNVFSKLYDVFLESVSLPYKFYL